MGKSHFWVNHYQKQGDLIEIKILDQSEALVEKWRFNINDKKNATRILKLLKEKYGFSPEIKPRSILEKEKDLNWLKD